MEPCVDWPPSPHASFLEPEGKPVSAGCPCPAAHGKDSDSPAKGGEVCVSGFLGSPGVEVTSWHGQLPLANRLEATICKGE